MSTIGSCDSTDYAEIDELEEARRHPELQYFGLSTIIAAIDNFSPINKLGQGGPLAKWSDYCWKICRLHLNKVGVFNFYGFIECVIL
ncbi:unnamed protein product [Malus baccata var. baccata]